MAKFIVVRSDFAYSCLYVLQDYLQVDSPAITWNAVLAKMLGCEPTEE